MRAPQRTNRLTAIKVGAEWWHVPAGFGADYLRRLDLISPPWVVVRVLQLVGYTATPEVVAAWPMQRRIEAESYAARAHLVASDNKLQSHPLPEWMGEPWQGPERVGPAWELPSPTVLR